MPPGVSRHIGMALCRGKSAKEFSKKSEILTKAYHENGVCEESVRSGNIAFAAH